MTAASMAETVSPKLLEVTERAKRSPQMRFFSLAHLIDEEALERAYGRIRKDAAVGVDGVTKEQYGQELESNVADLHGRMKTMRYRHQPLRRVHIPKGKGATRPIGISCSRGQGGPGGASRGAGSSLRADLLSRLVRLPARS